MKQTIYRVKNQNNRYHGSLFVPNLPIEQWDVRVEGWVTVPLIAGGSITHEGIWMMVDDIEIYAEHELVY